MVFKHTLAAASLGLMFAAFSPVQAAVQSYTFSGMMDSGHYINERFSGVISFDDATLTGAADEWLAIDSLTMSILGHTYTQADADAGSQAEVGYIDGALLGLSYSVTAANIGFSFIPGFADSSDAYIAYDTSQGLSGAGNVIYAPVPEPRDWMLMLAGLGLVGMMVGRNRRRSL